MAPVPPIRPDAALRAPAEIRSAIRQASDATGVPFDYLASQAEQESGFRADARAATGSAAGLYQFIETTWLRMMRDHGERYGMGEFAAAITTTESGPRVADPALKAKILALRNDPKLSAAMAAEYARGNHAHLQQSLGREIGATDLYLAHFLGAGGATRFLTALRSDPGRAAADVLPDAAAANRAVFFAGDGRARSIDEIYDRFAAKFDPGRAEIRKPGETTEPPGGPAPFEFVAAADGTRRLEAVMRQTTLATLSGSILSPTVIAALASLDAPDAADEPDAARAARTGDRHRR